MYEDVVKRPAPFPIRLYPAERAWIEETAKEQNCSQAQVIHAALKIMSAVAGINGWATME
jgi:hypothetical protein